MAETKKVAAAGANGRRVRRERTGIVKSDRGDKTITVVCNYKIRHPSYGKYVSRRTTLRAHDESNQAKVGDRVRVMECRPVSKSKHWRLVSIEKSA